MKTVSSVCCYCGTGCGVRVSALGDTVVAVEGDASHPANLGRLCSKGRTLADTVRRDEARVLYALVRPQRGAALQPVPLDEAMDRVADRLAAVIGEHGPDALGFYLSGQLLTEDYAVFNKLARALVGSNNIDTNSRLCMSSAVAGYKLTLGADAPPACYDDIALADCVLIAGSNMAYAHPVLFRRLEEARAARPQMKVIVVDPRRTDTASVADLHLPIVPGSDVALFHAMLNVMVWEGLVDADYIDRHTEGFAALKRRIHEFTPKATAAVCGVPADDIVAAARLFGEAGAALSFYTMGLNQSTSGSANNAALIHLHLACGQIGRPGSGPFSLTGQPNAMGGREAGGMATLLPGHRDPADPVHRAEVAALWGVDALPAAPGLPAVQLFDAALDDRVKALWIAATNPAASLPDQARVRAALERADFVVVSEAYASSDTLAFADVVLPAATWPEKDGTVTNSERRVSRVRAAIAPPGDAQPDWMLACGVARRLAARIAPHKAALFDYAGPAAIFAEHARTTAGRDLDYSGLGYEVLERLGPQQWPFRPGQAARPDGLRLYADGVFPTASGRARFVDVGYQPVAEPPSAHYPVRLTSGRLRDHWHTTGRTGLSATLLRHVEEPMLYLAPADLERFKLSAGELARVKSRRGALVLPVAADPGLKSGHAFVPMHWGRGWMAGDGVNVLASPALDPVSQQPELKHAAVAVAPARLGWQAVAWLRGDAALLRPRLQHWLERAPYAVLLPVADGGGGLRLRLALDAAPEAETLARLMAELGLSCPDAAFDDPARGVYRRLCLDDDGRPAVWLLAGDTRAAPGLAAWSDGGAAPRSLVALFSGREAVACSRVVCACEGVREDAIRAGVAAGLDVDGLKRELRCGTGCGSCVPELARLAAV